MLYLSTYLFSSSCIYKISLAIHTHQTLHTKGTTYIIGRRRTSVPLCSYNDSHVFDLCAIGTRQYLIPIVVRREAVYRERWKTRTQGRFCKNENGRTDKNRI